MLNQCQFIGNLGADPIIRSTQNGKEIASLSLGVSETWKNKDGERMSKTEWVRITIFSEGLTKIAKNYLKKGSKVFISGQLQTSKYTDKDGIDKTSTEVVLQGYNSALILLDGKRGETAPEAPSSTADEVQKQFPGATVMDDEIPF